MRKIAGSAETSASGCPHATAASTPLRDIPAELVICTAHVGVGRSVMAPASNVLASLPGLRIGKAVYVSRRFP